MIICSVAAIPADFLERMHERSLGVASALARAPAGEGALALGWPTLDEALPDGGLPRGVVELRAPRALGCATSIAIAAVRAAQRKSPKAWAAWVDAEASLYAPGLAQRGVDLARLVVVRPEREDLARVATKAVASCAFDVVVVDADAVGGDARVGRRTRRVDALFVRRLALGAERAGATVLLISDALAPRREPWPVALRLELARDATDDAVVVRIGKERHGRLGGGARAALAEGRG